MSLYRVPVLALLVTVLAGCAARPSRPGRTYGAPYDSAPTATETAAAATVLNVIATPFYLVFKAAVCATTVVLGAPAAAVLAVTDPDTTGWQRQDLNEGFAANCGPPYIPF